MKLETLKVELQPSYADNPGKYIATMEWEGERKTKLKLVCEPEFSETLLLLVAPILEEQAKRSAEHFHASILLSVKEARALPEIPVE